MQVLERLLNETITIRQVLEQQAAANEVQRYCLADERCPGGVPVLRHAPTYQKNDGMDADRFYHPLPESACYVYEGEGAFKGSIVRNHNVWRSRTTTVGTASGEQVEPDEPGTFDEAGVWVPDEPTHDQIDRGLVPDFQNAGELLGWALAEYRLARSAVLQVLNVEIGVLARSTPEQLKQAAVGIMEQQ